MTLTEITDTRLDTIGHARDVLERACEEYNAWRGPGHLRLLGALAVVERELAAWDGASGKDLDAAAQGTSDATARLVGVFGDVIGADAAAYISDSEGQEAA